MSEQSTPAFSLSRFPETLAVVRLPAGAEIPAWAESSSVFSITATATETSLVCAGRSVPKKARHEKPWTAFSIDGTLDLSVPGLLVQALAPLAEDAIPVFVLSTFDTDWILVRTADADRAEEAWRRSGYAVAPAVPV
ncbi:MAG TPA: ACT domain-containing protein [Nocardioides sp.]|nr:ACT domain-containing protein [Nocardioides sp.]